MEDKKKEKKRSFRGEHSVNEVPGMTQASNEAWMANIRRTSSDRDAGGNGFIEVSALIHQSIIREETIRAAADGAAFTGLTHGYRKQHLSAVLIEVGAHVQVGERGKGGRD